MRKILFLSFNIFLIARAGATPVPKDPIVIVLSSGFGTCSDQFYLKMKEYLHPFAQQAESQGHPVQFVASCFSKMREDMEYFSFDQKMNPVRIGVVHGGKHFEENFRNEFLQGYLKKIIPSKAKVVVVGQSHGGWVALQVAASRPVDFVVTLDEINRTECNFKNFFRTLRLMKEGQCSSAETSSNLIAGVDSMLEMSGGTGLNLYQDAAKIRSGPLNSKRMRDVDFGKYKTEYNAEEGNHGIATAHKDLAVDPDAWRRILSQLDKRMKSLDPTWRSIKAPVDDAIQLAGETRNEPMVHR